MKKIILSIIGFIFLIILLIYLTLTNSLKSSVKVVDWIFSLTPQITDSTRFKKEASEIEIQQDIFYESSFNNSEADIFYPKNKGSFPTVFWIHGGGYVSGSKENVTEFSTYLANKAQVAVVSVNYELAPNSQYPGQLIQTAEMYDYFLKNKEKFPMLDLTKVFFGGDSAGAQIAAQYLTTQTNLDYGNKLDIPPLLEKKHLKGALLYCGPLDFLSMQDMSEKSLFSKFFINTVSWALLGNKKWQGNPTVEEASIVKHMTSDFPPSYVTDGNTVSFPEQGLSFVDKANKLAIPTTSLFFEEDDASIPHEYQFDFTTENALKNFDLTINFIEQQLK